MEKKRICFVCLGNIVRSPLAEHLFRRVAEQAGVAQSYEVDSAGTGSWHLGERPDSRMRKLAAQRGLKYDGRARKFLPADLDHFDYVIVMDRENYANVLALVRSPEQQKKVHMLREFDPRGGQFSAVPDPYYGGLRGFEDTYQIVERSVKGLLNALEAGQL